MRRVLKQIRWPGLGVGLLLGVALSGRWPSTPLYGVATDHSENAVMCTVPLDQDVEGLFYVDSLTGTLLGVVPSRGTKGTPQASWVQNVNQDLAAFIATWNARLKAANGKNADKAMMQPPQNPKYMMVSGVMDFPVRAQVRPGRGLIYVGEASTGVVLCYMIPWNGAAHIANQPWNSPLELWSANKFADVVVRKDE